MRPEPEISRPALGWPPEQGRSLFERVVVLLDKLAPGGGAFDTALHWASRLHLPLHGVGACTRDWLQQTVDATRDRDCAAACARYHVAWDVLPGTQTDANARELAGPHDLLVLGQALPADRKHRLLHDAGNRGGPGILICPDTVAPVARILLVDRANPADGNAVTVAAALGAALQARLFVLTVARTEREGKRRQTRTQHVLAQRAVPADVDLVIGSEVRLAAAQVARWRRCQLVVTGCQSAAPWWRWLREEPSTELMELAGAFAFLRLPPLDEAEKWADMPATVSDRLTRSVAIEKDH